MRIFGPVLGISTYTRVGEVIDALAGKPAPLVAYWFGPDTADFRDFVRRTRSGGVARNEFGIHMPSDARSAVSATAGWCLSRQGRIRSALA